MQTHVALLAPCAVRPAATGDDQALALALLLPDHRGAVDGALLQCCRGVDPENDLGAVRSFAHDNENKVEEGKVSKVLLGDL